MIIFTMLLMIIGIISIITLIALLTGGAALVLVFGDLIVCVGIIVFIVKMLRRNK